MGLSRRAAFWLGWAVLASLVAADLHEAQGAVSASAEEDAVAGRIDAGVTNGHAEQLAEAKSTGACSQQSHMNCAINCAGPWLRRSR